MLSVCNTNVYLAMLIPCCLCAVPGMKSVTGRLQNAVSGVEDLFITVALDQPLLSEEQKRELNPMIITVKSVTDMPNSPMSFEELSSK